MESCLNAMCSSIASHEDGRTSLQELLKSSYLFIDLVRETQMPLIHSSSSTSLDQTGTPGRVLSPPKCAHYFITQCLPVLMQKAAPTIFDDPEIGKRMLKLLTKVLQVILTFSLPPDARDLTIECLRQIKRLVNIRETEGKKLLFLFILTSDNDISEETFYEIQAGLTTLLEEGSCSLNSEYCGLMLYGLVKSEDATFDELNALISRILETFGQWRPTFQRNGFRLLLKLLTSQYTEEVMENRTINALSELVTAIKTETIELLASDFMENVELLSVVISHERLGRFAVHAVLMACKREKMPFVVNVLIASLRGTECFARYLTTLEASEIFHDNQERLSIICELIHKVVGSSPSIYWRFNPVMKCALLLMDMQSAVIDLDKIRIRILLQLSIAAVTAVSIIPSIGIDLDSSDASLHSKFICTASTFYSSTEALQEILIIICLILQKSFSPERDKLDAIISKKDTFLQKAVELHFPLVLQLLLTLRLDRFDFTNVKLSGPRLQNMVLDPAFPPHQRLLAIQVRVYVILLTCFVSEGTLDKYFTLENVSAFFENGHPDD